MTEVKTVRLDFDGRDVHYSELTGLAYVSTCAGVLVYKGTEAVRILGEGSAMAISPSGKYLLTGGGIYNTTEPFELVQDMPRDIESATFLGSDSQIAVVIDGGISTYSRGDDLEWGWLNKVRIENEYVRQIIYGQGVIVALMKSGYLRSLDSNIFEKQRVLYLRTLSIVPSRPEWRDPDARLVCDGASPGIVSESGISKMNWKNMGDVVVSYTKHHVDAYSRDHELIVYRGSARTEHGLFYVSGCGKYLTVPVVKKSVEPQQSKTGRRRGAITRSKSGPAAVFKSINKN